MTTEVSVDRLREITLENFCGFKGTHKLDTDADIVLITGPNGYGKTSLLRAITYLLTGHHGLEDEKYLSYGNEKEGKQYRLSAQVNTPPHSLTLGPENKGQAVRLENKDQAVELKGPRLDDPELRARLCAFFQDKIDILFDEAAKGKTLRDVFDPLPPRMKTVETALEDSIAELEKEVQGRLYQDEWSGEKPEELERAFREAWTEAHPTLPPLVAAFKDRRSALGALGSPPADAKGAEDFLSALLKALGRSLEITGKPLCEALRRAIAEEEKYKTEELKKDAAEYNKEVMGLQDLLEKNKKDADDITKKHPNLEDSLKHFEPKTEGHPGALQVFQALAENAGRWAKFPKGGETLYERVLDELALVDPAEAGKCAEGLEEWLGNKRRAWKRLEELRLEREDLEEKLKGAKAYQAIEDLKSISKAAREALSALEDPWEAFLEHQRFLKREEGRKQARALIAAATAELGELQKEVNTLTAPDKELMEDLQKRANAILGRFSLVDGILPLKLVAEEGAADDKGYARRSYSIKTKDGRELANLSTGQKAQVAVSLLASQNIAVTNYLNHRVMLLDDMTTAYDLSNLTREALLWRQFAYAQKDKETGDFPIHKRQVFISSHHEDMSNHLLDLLVPPPGGTMRLIRLTGWDPETGPSFESFTVEPSEAVDNDTLFKHLGAL